MAWKHGDNKAILGKQSPMLWATINHLYVYQLLRKDNVEIHDE